MTLSIVRALLLSSTPARARRVAAMARVVLVLAVALAASSQEPVPATPAQTPAQTDTTPQPASPAQTPAQPDATQQPVTPEAKPDDNSQPATPAQTPGPPPAPPDAAQQSASPSQNSPASDNSAQTPASPDTSVQPASAPAAGSEPDAQKTGKADADQSAKSTSEEAGSITEDELKTMLIGKPLFLRNGYLFDQLSYNELGMLIGKSPHASYTLSAVQIDKVRLTKHKLELEGARYGLHFLGALATEDPATAMDRVKITPKKKTLKITIDREIVIKPKKEKPVKPVKAKPADAQVVQSKESIAKATATLAPVMPEPVPASASDATATTAQAPGAPPAGPQAAEAPKTADTNAAASPTPAATTSDAAQPEAADADQVKADMAAAPKEERPADPNSVTFTLSPAHAAKILKKAINNVFATGLDDRMMASMPDFWKLYYQAALAKTDYQPTDPAVLRQTMVDDKAKLTSTFEPASNQYAQDNGVAGMALYHVVIGPDGAPGEVAVARPIGFGLDENAVTAIKAAKFSPATKDGKPVPVLLDLVVQFRIYSKRTSIIRIPGQEDNPAAPILPGPYTAHELAVRRRESQQQQQPQPSSN